MFYVSNTNQKVLDTSLTFWRLDHGEGGISTLNMLLPTTLTLRHFAIYHLTPLPPGPAQGHWPKLNPYNHYRRVFTRVLNLGLEETKEFSSDLDEV